MQATGRPLRIAIIAGEASGDVLGASLMRALKDALSDVEFYGILGPQMRAEHGEPWFDIRDLSVMGFRDVLAKLPSILKIRRSIIKRLLTDPPDLFIGIDAPDFNLPLEVKLKKAGIPVVHYVSPTIWAWRSGRIKQIAKGVDLMLTLFPFEVALYQRHGIAAVCVGHPLANELQPCSVEQARDALHMPHLTPIVALLPGSRHGDLRYMAKPMIQAAKQLLQIFPTLSFVAPMVDAALADHFQSYVDQYAPGLPMKVVLQQSALALSAADCAMVKSGTSTLQAMLLGIPQVVVYNMGLFTGCVLWLLVKARFIAFPNILAKQAIVPELVRPHAKPTRIANEMMALLTDPEATRTQLAGYQLAAQGLQGDASLIACDAILERFFNR